MIKKFILFYFLVTFNLSSQELIIGNERVEPGIVFVFEGAIKDKVFPLSLNLSENQANVHIEARVNWDITNVPSGVPPGGFVPYLKISAIITNQSNAMKSFIDLYPHLNLTDNFHYARNIALPGSKNDFYKVEFLVNSPSKFDLFYHNDWSLGYGLKLIEDKIFIYENINFSKIANSTRY